MVRPRYGANVFTMTTTTTINATYHNKRDNICRARGRAARIWPRGSRDAGTWLGRPVFRCHSELGVAIWHRFEINSIQLDSIRLWIWDCDSFIEAWNFSFFSWCEVVAFCVIAHSVYIIAHIIFRELEQDNDTRLDQFCKILTSLRGSIAARRGISLSRSIKRRDNFGRCQSQFLLVAVAERL